MSIDIRDWPKLCSVLEGDIQEMVEGRRIDVADFCSLEMTRLRIHLVTTEPEFGILDVTDKIPSKFKEIIPPLMESPTLLLRLRLALKGPASGELSASLSLDSPCAGFATFPLHLQVSRLSFTGVVEVVLGGDQMAMVGLQECSQFDVSIASALGHDPIRPRQLDTFLEGKARQAIELLHVHPITLAQDYGR